MEAEPETAAVAPPDADPQQQRPAEPQPTEPDAIELDAPEPQPAEPDAVEPQPPGPDAVEPLSTSAGSTTPGVMSDTPLDAFDGPEQLRLAPGQPDEVPEAPDRVADEAAEVPVEPDRVADEPDDAPDQPLVEPSEVPGEPPGSIPESPEVEPAESRAASPAPGEPVERSDDVSVAPVVSPVEADPTEAAPDEAPGTAAPEPAPPTVAPRRAPVDRRLQLVVIGGWGVLLQPADPAGELLIPFLRRAGSTASSEEIRNAYHLATLGRLTPNQLWEACGLQGDPTWEHGPYTEGTTVSPGAADFVRSLLRRKIRVACITNDVSEWSWRLRSWTGFEAVEPWVISSDIGMRKPDPGVFEMLRRVAEVSFVNCLVIDSDPRTLDTARSLGMSTALFGALGAEQPPTAVAHPSVGDFTSLLRRTQPQPEPEPEPPGMDL